MSPRQGAKGSPTPDGEHAEQGEQHPAADTSSTAPQPVRASRNALAAGAARASGERRRRAGTPLLSSPGTVEVSAARRDSKGAQPEPQPQSQPGPAAQAPTAKGRVARRLAEQATQPPADEPTAASAEPPVAEASADDEATAPAPAGRRPSRSAIRAQSRLRAVPDPATPAEDPRHAEAADAPEPAQRHTSALGSGEVTSSARPSPAEFVELAINVLRSAAMASGVPADQVEQRVAETLAYVRRRLTGDYTVDEFGFDQDWTDNVHLPLLRPLYQKWFRVEVKGIENLPAEGGALVVANHSGTVAIDGLMTQLAVHDEHPAHRHLRLLGADLVFQTPFVGTIARRSGATLASNYDAERLLAAGHLVGVYPEGFKGVGKPYSERYKLQRFGRGGFVSAALRAGVPIIPCSIVGAEEIYPIIGNMPTVARLLGLPYAPITPTFPLLGPLGLIPLPSKWLMEFGPPIDTASFGPEAADDPMLVFDLTDQVRETIQQTLYSLLMQRQSVFI